MELTEATARECLDRWANHQLNWYELPEQLQEIGYERWSSEMPYGTITGDTQTPDEWFDEYPDPLDIVDEVMDGFLE